MKNHLLIALLLCAFAFLAKAQSPQSFTYQAVARDAAGNVLVNKSIGLRMSVVSGTTTVYTETFTVNTNAYGMFTVTLGTGAPVTGSFFTINWAEGSSSPKSLKVELDAAGGTAYTTMGTTTFNSVPFAFVADKAINTKLDELTDVNAPTPTASQVLQWNGSAWVAATVTAGAVQTDASLSGDGSTGSPLKVASQGATNGQVLQWNGSAWLPATVSGGVGDNWGTQFVKTSVALSGSGTAADPLNIAKQGAAVGESMIWNGSVWGPGRPAIAIDNVFSGTGTPATPLKLSQQGAIGGDVLKWNGTTWIPGAPFTLPYYGTGTGAAGLATFTISNPSSSGPSRNAIDALSNGGIALNAESNPASGKAVSGKSDSGIGIYGASTSGTAGFFDGTVAVIGDLKVFGAQVLKSSDISVFDQTSTLNLQSTVATAVTGLDAMNFTVGNSASVGAPAKVLITFNTPVISTTSNTSSTKGEGFQLQLLIKQGASIIKQVNCNSYVAGLGIKSFSYTMHHKITAGGSYTASILLYKSDGSASKDITIAESQVQIQVINP